MVKGLVLTILFLVTIGFITSGFNHLMRDLAMFNYNSSNVLSLMLNLFPVYLPMVYVMTLGTSWISFILILIGGLLLYWGITDYAMGQSHRSNMELSFGVIAYIYGAYQLPLLYFFIGNEIVGLMNQIA